MNEAERVLRASKISGPAKEAVKALDRWSKKDRDEFRAAFQIDDTLRMYKLAGVDSMVPYREARRIFLCLNDAVTDPYPLNTNK